MVLEKSSQWHCDVKLVHVVYMSIVIDCCTTHKRLKPPSRFLNRSKQSKVEDHLTEVNGQPPQSATSLCGCEAAACALLSAVHRTWCSRICDSYLSEIILLTLFFPVFSFVLFLHASLHGDNGTVLPLHVVVKCSRVSNNAKKPSFVMMNHCWKHFSSQLGIWFTGRALLWINCTLLLSHPLAVPMWNVNILITCKWHLWSVQHCAYCWIIK